MRRSEAMVWQADCGTLRVAFVRILGFGEPEIWRQWPELKPQVSSRISLPELDKRFIVKSLRSLDQVKLAGIARVHGTAGNLFRF